tara:strand:+ start:177 stop:461 length:285 start_codon:yes stop_codon:yes gene_type:complete
LFWLNADKDQNDAIENNSRVFDESAERKHLLFEKYLKQISTNGFIASAMGLNYKNMNMPGKKLELSIKVFANNYCQQGNINVFKANRRFLKKNH